jgi:hypothetical protein
MGAAMQEYMAPQKCYNSQNHWRLGWFADRQIEIDSGTLLTGPKLLHIAAFVDYEKTQYQNDGFLYHVLARIEDVFYLQYNRAKDYNIGTTELGDKLVVVKLNTTTGTSDVLVGLDDGLSLFQFPVSDQGDNQNIRNLVFEVCRVVVKTDSDTSDTSGNENPDYIILSVGYDSSCCKDFLANPAAYMQTNTPTTVPSDAKQISPSEAPTITVTGTPQPPPSSARPTPKNEIPIQSIPRQPAEGTGPPTQLISIQPTTKNETMSSQFDDNRSVFVLFLVFQVCFLLALFILYLLFVRQYKKQKELWNYKEDQKYNLQLLALNGRTNHDAQSLFNEVDDDLSSTVSFATEGNDKQFYLSGLQRPERLAV